MSRAGYVPQLFSLRLPNPAVVFELLERAQAGALVYEPSFEDAVKGSPVPSHRAPSVQGFVGCAGEILPPLHTPESRDDLVFIFHTSGSTSGSPKLVPCTAGYVDSVVFKSYEASAPVNPLKQSVSTWM